MNILIVSNNYHPELTGIGKYSGETADWLARNGHTVKVICSPPYYPEWKVSSEYKSWQYKKEKINGVNVVRCPIWVPLKPNGFKRVLHLVSFSLSSFFVVLWQFFNKPDVVICIEPSLSNTPSALLLSKLSKSKTILHIQDFEIDVAFELGIIKNRLLKRFLLWSEKKILNSFDIVSTSSEAMVTYLTTKDVPQEKKFLFPNWVDTSAIYPLQREGEFRSMINLPQNHTLALYSGNMGEKQGLEIIIQAADMLKDRNIYFLMCGSGSALARLKEISSHLHNVIWIDLQPLEKLNELLNSADIHLLPQLPGAADLLMPSKLNGMLSSGKPIVATAEKDTQVEKVVATCGVVTPPCDVEKFADGINLLMNNKKLASDLGGAARQYAEQCLEYNSIMQKLNKKLLSLS